MILFIETSFSSMDIIEGGVFSTGFEYIAV
jgi:hypothetical protein